MRRISLCTAAAAATLIGSMSHTALAGPDRESEANMGTRELEATDSPSASPSRDEGQAKVSTKAVWYGDSVLIADLAALGLGALSLAAATSGHSIEDLSLPAGLAGLATYVAGGPIIHATRGNYGNMGESIALRLLTPIGGALVGAGIGAASESGCSGDWCGIGAAIGGIFGFGGGMVLASVLDIAAVSYDSPPDPQRPQVALLPTVDTRQGGVALNLVGTW
jgi:hypothetical protein